MKAYRGGDGLLAVLKFLLTKEIPEKELTGLLNFCIFKAVKVLFLFPP